MSERTDKTRAAVREKWDPEFEWVVNEFIPWAHPRKPLARSRVGLVSTAGVYLKNQFHQPFDGANPYGDPSFREFPNIVDIQDLRTGHTHYNLTYAEQDLNVVFPIDRMREMARMGVIGELAPLVYSFMGYVTRPVRLLADYIPNLVERLRRMDVDAVLLNAV